MVNHGAKNLASHNGGFVDDHNDSAMIMMIIANRATIEIYYLDLKLDILNIKSKLLIFEESFYKRF